MQKYAVLYATYAEVYILHILHLYALPTLVIKQDSVGGRRSRDTPPVLMDSGSEQPVQAPNRARARPCRQA